ncbi:TIM-barrel domain-containing protein [Pseudokineococcus marinus]|uniref:Glycoside hydrolase n=1 Tax=Pseudokineococcus marinus TaxID=351215 RepID=A0A849BMK9_9ACTN|nr:TIM-barrel domain-containing protein [Pseudokineococcus marinus]NNH22583.1 glycoside hydrolase [Pseudokineococcus marinus]
MPLPEALPSRPVADPRAVVQGATYRFTVLTDGLVRMEHSADGRFEDRASTFALNRELPVPKFRVVDSGSHLEILTSRFHLTYDKGSFTTSGLQVSALGGITHHASDWRYGQVPDDLGGTARTLDEADGAIPLEPGVVSRTGLALVDDGGSFCFEADGWVAADSVGRTDLYLFTYGLDHEDALRALRDVSGPTPVLPRYALGTWWSRYHRYTTDTYLALVERFRQEEVPLSVSVIDMDWHLVDIDPALGSGWTGYTWDRELFPDPPAFLAALHERGLRVTLNVHPADGVRRHEEAYPAMAEALGCDAAEGLPISFDVTDPDFMAAYLEVLHHPLEEQGVDFWWLDWQSGPHSRVTGVDPLWVLNHLHYLDDGRDGRRPLTFSRYAGPGSHRYPVGFSGDTVISWASLAFQPFFTATAANIGYGWWSHDVGGHFFGTRDDELTTRWVQLGVFSPVTRLHSGADAFISKAPWDFPAAAREVMVEHLRLRHRLLPYLHTMNHRAAAEGLPLVQPMYHRWPHAQEAYRVPNQTTFGTQLVVAPITEPADRRTLLAATRAWLPAGTWVDVMTDLVYDGDREVVLHRDLTTIPVLAPAGALVPLDGETRPGNGTANPDHLEVLVVVGADGSLELLEDDDTTTGELVRTPLTYDQATGRLTVGPATGPLDAVPARRTWTLTFVALDDAATPAVMVDDVARDAVVRRTATRTSVVVEDVAPSSTVSVDLGAAPALRPNDVHDRVFRLLDRAQVEHVVKNRAYAVVTADQPAALRASRLQALDLEPALLAAVGEVLLARA